MLELPISYTFCLRTIRTFNNILLLKSRKPWQPNEIGVIVNQTNCIHNEPNKSYLTPRLLIVYN